MLEGGSDGTTGLGGSDMVVQFAERLDGVFRSRAGVRNASRVRCGGGLNPRTVRGFEAPTGSSRIHHIHRESRPGWRFIAGSRGVRWCRSREITPCASSWWYVGLGHHFGRRWLLGTGRCGRHRWRPVSPGSSPANLRTGSCGIRSGGANRWSTGRVGVWATARSLAGLWGRYRRPLEGVGDLPGWLGTGPSPGGPQFLGYLSLLGATLRLLLVCAHHSQGGEVFH